MFQGFLQDLRSSLRAFARQPLFTLTAMCSLALGIGACVVIYSVVYAVLLKPLPYARPEQLVHVNMANPSIGSEAANGIAPMTVANILTRPDTGLSALGGQTYDYCNLTGVEQPTQLTVGLVTEQYLGVFGIQPALGRLFDQKDFRADAAPTVVLADKLWRSQFHADPGLLGQTIRIDDKPRTVVGIMPASFKEPNNVAQVWLPIQANNPMASAPGSRALDGMGRLNAATAENLHRTRAALETVAANLAATDPVNYKGWQLTVDPLGGATLAGRAQQHALWLLLGGVGCVLLVTCANVANLQLVRASARRREMGVRMALGASRTRIGRQLLAESALLAGVGGGLGLLLASWGVDGVRALLPAGFTRQDEIALDLPVLAFAVALTALVGVASGTLPMWFAARQDPAGSLADGGRAAAGGVGGARTRAGLVVAEISLALVLLAGAGLLGRSFLSLLRADPGFRTERVLTLGMSLALERYPDKARSVDFYRHVLEAVRAVPGVENVGLSTTQFFNWTMRFTFLKAGQAGDDPAAAAQAADYDAINPECFATLDIPLRRGRVFNAQDNAAAPPVMIVNEEFARRFFPAGVDPLGQKLVIVSRNDKTTLEIVGVTADLHRQGANEPVAPQMYVSCFQRPPNFATLYVRAAAHLPAESLTRPVQAAVWNLDRELPVSDVSTLAQDLHGTTSLTRLYLALFALFAGLTLGLAALGVYGTVSYSVGQRTREIGIRMAVGAQRGDVLRLVLGQGVRLILTGLGLGLAASLALARLVASLLYGVDARDPLTLGLVAVLLGAVALLASYLPARRAALIDPLTALRED